MNTKRLMSSIVALILVICTLLTSCKTADSGHADSTTASATTTTDASTTTKKPDGTTSTPTGTTTPSGTTATPDNTTSSPNVPDDPADNCAHAATVKQNVKAASCITKGYTGDDVCSSCGIVVNKGSETELTDHVYDNGKVTKTPTCIDQGVLTYTCTGCGTTKTDSIAKADHADIYHDYLDGTHSHTCENCALSENAAHTPKDAGVLHAADCLNAEYTEYTCALCEGVYKVYTEGSKSLGCSYGDWSTTKEATCSVEGEMTRSCSRCHGVETIAIPVSDAAHSHKLVNTFPASCSDEGTERYKCEFCDDAYTVTIQKTAHTFNSVETPGDGWTHKLCDCGYKLSTFDAKDLIEAEVKTDDIPEDNSFEVSLEKADIVFPETVVSQFKDNAGDLSIKADVMPESHKNDLINAQGTNLTKDQKDRLAEVPVYDFGVKLGGEYVESFESDVSVTLPYTLKDGEDPEGIVVWYVKEDGSIENVTAVYNESAKTVTFSVSHFSFYAIAYEETQEMRCKRGNHAYYATPVVVDASCTQHGYTLYECECCHYKLISDIKEKLNHNLGNVIQPNVDCTTGGYTHRICADCGYTVNIDYVRAKGHTPGSAATCDTPCVCTVCKAVIIAAKGHKYTEWETVKAPTGSEEGLKRRYCTNCGKAEEKTVPPTGLAEKMEFKSYGELYNYVFRDLLRIDGGVLTIDVDMTNTSQSSNQNQKVIITIENDGTNYTILTERRETTLRDGVTKTASVYILVRNGMVFQASPSENGQSYIYISSNDSIEVEAQLAETIYNAMREVDYSFSMMFELADALVTFGNLAPEKVNELFASADIAMDIDEFKTFVNTLKAEYSYIASLFSYDTEVTAPEGVKAGGISNILSLLTGVMTNNGNGKYSYMASSLLDAAKELINTYDSYAELPFSDALYDLIKEEILKKYPDLTTRALVEAKIRESFPGTMKVSEAVDKIMTSICGNDASKLDSVYEAINSIAKIYVSSGTEFDIEEMILEYSNYTLDGFVQETMDYDSLACLFDEMFAEAQSTLFKEALGYYRTSYEEVVTPDGYVQMVPGEKTFYENQMIATIREYVNLGEYSADSKLEIGIKDDGLIDYISGKLGVTADTGSETGTIYFKNDKNTKITFPTLLENVKDQKVELSYDANGNIVISGGNTTLPELTFDLGGYAYVDFSSMMVKDNDLSAERGFDVYYPNDKTFWESHISNETPALVEYNGVMYSVGYYGSSSYKYIAEEISLKNIISNPLSYISTTDADQDGYVQINGENVPVYSTLFGLVYQNNGEWMLIYDKNLDYNYRYESVYDSDKGYYVEKSYKLWYDYSNGNIVSEKLADIVSTLSLSNVEMTYYSYIMTEDGKSLDRYVYELNFSVQNDKWGDYTLSMYGEVESDGTITVFKTAYHQGEEFAVLDEVWSASDLSGFEEYYSYKQSRPLYDRNGNKIADSYTCTYYVIRERVPTYYVKLGDSYVNLDALRAINVSDYEEITLPDSTKLYVVHRDGDTNNGVIYGFTPFTGNLYVESACIFENGALTDKLFRYESAAVQHDFSDDNISKYITRSGNSYIISAELLTKYTELCKNSVGRAYFRLTATSETETDTLYTEMSLLLYEHFNELFYGSSSSQPSANIDWYRAFNNISYDYYTVKVNNDGTISLWFGDGSKIEMVLDNDKYKVVVSDDVLTKDQDLSTSTGLDVGSATVTNTANTSYLYIDGKYYNYSNYSVIKSETVTNVESLFATTFSVSELYYRYDFTDDNGKTHKIYHGSVTINRMDYFGYSEFDAFFMLDDDGKLMVLKGAEEKGESVLKFEEIVSFDSYVSSLTFEYSIENDKWSSSTTCHLNGAMRDVYSTYAYIYETVAGEKIEIGSFLIHYYKVGNTYHFIKNVRYDKEKGNYIKKGELATLPDNVVNIKLNEITAYNGIFTYAHVYYTYDEKETFIKIDGTYYAYDYNADYSCYLNYRMTEADALKLFANLEWTYVIEKYENGSWKGYECKIVGNKKDYFVVELTGKIIDFDDAADWSQIGYTNDGYAIYELSYYTMPDDLIADVRPDGTIFYAKAGQNMGVLKCPDGYYLEAQRVQMNDGTTKIVCTELNAGRAYINADAMLNKIDKYITFNESGTVATISKDIIPALEELFGYNVYDFDFIIRFTSSSGRSFSIYARNLAEYFGYNSNTNDKNGK